jgi:uncharacterized membrane protein YuzA (DUF378 family)
MNSLKKWLLSPYPFPTKVKSKVLISFGIGIFVIIFLLIFKPFDFYKLAENEIGYYTFIYGLNTTGIILLCYFILPKIFRSFFNPYKWNIYKMIFFILLIVTSIGIANWIFSGFSSFNIKESEYGFLFFQITALLVGVFPLLVYIYFTEQSIHKKNKSIAESISLVQKKNPIKNEYKESDGVNILLKGDNKKEELTLYLDNLIYINSEKNYASIFHLKDGNLKESLLRISLNRIENQLSKYSCIVRCHKSYIVNTNKVTEIEGNARGYLLRIDNTKISIPVSRSFPKELLFTLVKK